MDLMQNLMGIEIGRMKMNKKIPKYTKKERNSDGEFIWSYQPPKKAIECGIVEPMWCEADRWVSYQKIQEQNNCLLYTSPSPRDRG